jgi:hypothetical protein
MVSIELSWKPAPAAVAAQGAPVFQEDENMREISQ